jgi:hypothetical protein
MQPRACTDRTVREFEELIVFLRCDVSRITRIAKMVLGFHERRTRELQVSRELLGPEPAEPSGDRPWRAS